MDQNSKMSNSGQYHSFPGLDESFLAYKRLCLERALESKMAGTATTSQGQGRLRASASEFVPKDTLENDRLTDDSYYEDDGYDVAYVMKARMPCNDGKSFSHPQYKTEELDETVSVEAKQKSKPKHSPHHSAHCPHRHSRHLTGRSTQVETTALPPKHMANGLPHFKGPYMPLLQHRMANAEAYGLIRGPNDINNNSILMQDLITQLSKLDSFSKEFERLSKCQQEYKPDKN